MVRENPAARELAAQFDELAAALEKYFRLSGFDEASAADLTAEVFQRSLLAKNAYDPRRASLKTWLFAIARNLAINAWKSRPTPEPVAETLPDRALLPEENLLREERQRELIEAVQTLEKRDREVLALKFAGGMNNREIGQLLGLRPNHVGVLLYRALHQLKEKLAEREGESDAV
jgi:RNA polymerase sigma-70 factor (ECF subfamily)